MFSLSAVETLRVVLHALDGWVLTLASPLAVAPLSEADTSMFSSMVALAATSVDNNRSSGSGEDGFSASLVGKPTSQRQTPRRRHVSC